jgi:hypothetical protein
MLELYIQRKINYKFYKVTSYRHGEQDGQRQCAKALMVKIGFIQTHTTYRVGYYKDSHKS